MFLVTSWNTKPKRKSSFILIREMYATHWLVRFYCIARSDEKSNRNKRGRTLISHWKCSKSSVAFWSAPQIFWRRVAAFCMQKPRVPVWAASSFQTTTTILKMVAAITGARVISLHQAIQFNFSCKWLLLLLKAGCVILGISSGCKSIIYSVGSGWWTSSLHLDNVYSQEPLRLGTGLGIKRRYIILNFCKNWTFCNLTVNSPIRFKPAHKNLQLLRTYSTKKQQDTTWNTT